MKFDNIGVKVRALRKERGLTQEKLAEMAEISINYLSKIENNKCRCPDYISFGKGFGSYIRVSDGTRRYE